MKKHLVRLFVFLYIAAFLFSGLAGVVTWADEPPTDETTLPQTEQTSEEGISALLDMEVSEPEWMSYSDFVLAQNQRSWDDPAIFVGCHALLNPGWTSINLSDNPQNGYVFSNIGDLDDENGDPILLTVVDCMQDSNGWLWYKVEAAEGYTLPQALADKPYVLHLDSVDAIPTLLWMPLEGTFLGETVAFKKEAVAAAAFVEVPTSELPATFAVSLSGDGWKALLTRNAYWTNALDQTYYDLGDTSGWHADLAEKNYHFVDASSVLLISPEVTLACQKLQSAGSAAEFNEIWAAIPDSVKELILPQQMEQLEARFDQLCSVRYETSVLFGDISVPVSVTGPIPESGVTLTVAPVTNEQVLAEGFDVKADASDVIAALDIKLLKEDNTEWQPEDGQQITVTIGMAELGIADETVVSLHHKHGDDIQKLDIFLVLDGKVTVYTGGLSIYVVSNTNQTNIDGIDQITNGSTLELTVGDNLIYYFRRDNGQNNARGTWVVEDTSGAIHYTVHSQTAVGHNGMYCPWIQIHALKATTETTTVSLRFYYDDYNNYESYTIKIVPPTAEAGKKTLYLKDDVNATGRLIATLVDENGEEQSLAGSVFRWSRDDNVLISPFAYGNMEIDGLNVSNISVNIARDHGGLVQARMNDNKTAYRPTTYTCVATLPDGSTATAKYTVYYQSEIINANFEFPAATNSNYTFFPNGYPELYWETTAPGTGNKRSMDIEYGDVTNGTANGNGQGTGFGVTRAADHEENPRGVQFAELNAEAIGALYQDIITAPGEEISWSFSHAPRQHQSWVEQGKTTDNKMFVVIGPTEDAQKLITQQQIQNRVLNTAIAAGVRTSGEPAEVSITEGDVTYKYVVWYHDAGAPPQGNAGNAFYTEANNYGWSKIEGSYEVPEGQYRTRLFFVSDLAANQAQNFGNLIDKARAGQYKTFLIEYYEETFEPNSTTATLVHMKDYDESGEALIYSTELLNNLDHFLTSSELGGEGDFLHQILINGANYPYTLRYLDTSGEKPVERAYLYIEKYAGTATHFKVANSEEGYTPNDYSQYDIVMQITLRDTVVAVQKVLEFPDTLTEEQKLKIMNALNANGGSGYNANFELTAVDATYNDKGEVIKTTPLESTSQPEDRTGTAFVTQRDPTGRYTGYISLGRNPSLGPDPEVGQHYTVTETDTTPIVGLELTKVVFATTMYKYGEADRTPIPTEYIEKHISGDEAVPLVSTPFILKNSQKIADIVVTNYYREKETEVIYKAVGTGKVQLKGTSGAVGDEPSETLAYYSGKAIGADAIPGKTAHFVGWFKDPECNHEVTSADGVYDRNTGSFIPNTNIIEADTVTFYALFETGSIVIERENGEPGETFTYLVEDVNTKKSFYVTVTCGENGKGSRTIYEVPKGTYRVTEIEDWSWRHTGDSYTEYYDGSYEHPYVFKFTSGVDKQSWLSGWSSLWKNLFKKGVKTIPEAST